MRQNAHFLSRKPARTTRVAVNYIHGVVRICAFHQPATAVDSNAWRVARYGVISHPQGAAVIWPPVLARHIVNSLSTEYAGVEWWPTPTQEK